MWNTDEFNKDCNVFTERAKTVEQNKKLKGNSPDYVLYKSRTDEPIAIIEAKRKGRNVEQAIRQAEERYAKPLGVKIIFAYDGAFFKSWHTEAQRELLIDGTTVTQLISEKKILRFLKEGYSISELSPKTKHTRIELINIFKWANDLFRKEGLREGIERFTEFANLLFLKLISEFEIERDKKGEPRILAEQYCWESFSDLDPTRMMNYINNTVLPKLVKEYNHSGDVFNKELLIKNPKTLAAIVKKLDTIKLMDADSDVKGDAFEYFLKDSIIVGNDLGEYFTPRHLVKLMIEITEPKFGEKIYDPTCGTGGFLIAAFNYIKDRCANTKENNRILKEESIFGGELTNTARIAKMNMILTGDGHTNIKQLDSLENPITEKFDLVLANPPYGQQTDYGDYYPIPSNIGDAIFIQHIYKSLKKDIGRAAVVVPEGLLFRRDLREVRKYLLEHCEIEGVISLPQGIFRPYTNNKTNIIVFRKDEKGTSKVWFYDLTADGFDLKSDLRKPVDNNDIPDLLSKWSEKEKSEKSWIADRDAIQKKKCDLLAKTYKPRIKFVDRYKTDFPIVKFSEIMVENKDSIIISDVEEYKRVKVQWYGKGVILRDKILGSKLKTKNQKVTKRNQFIVAEIDAKNGSFGVIPRELENAIVSSHYFLFDLDEEKVLPEYFDYMIRFGPYEELIQPYVKGTTNYAAIRPRDVFELYLPLPRIEIQEKIAGEIRQQLEIIKNAEETIKTLQETGVSSSFFSSEKRVKFADVVNISPKYNLTEKSKQYFVEMASVDELNGNIKHFMKRKNMSSGLARFRENDILFAKITPCTENGKIAIAKGLGDETGLGSTEFFVFSPKGVKAKWLYFLLKEPRLKEEIVSSMIGTTGRKRVPLRFFKNLEIPLVSEDKQIETIKELETYLNTIKSLKDVISLSKKTVDKMVSEIFTANKSHSGSS